MPSSIRDISAVATHCQKDLLFYVKEDGSINYYESASPKEADLKQYIENEVQQGGESVLANQELALVTAVAYVDPATKADELRVYYVQQGSTRKLRELCRTNDKEWRNGNGFNDIGAVLAEGSGLAANVAFGQLKVYYHSANQPKGKISVLYSNLGVGNWTPRSKIN